MSTLSVQQNINRIKEQSIGQILFLGILILGYLSLPLNFPGLPFIPNVILIFSFPLFFIFLFYFLSKEDFIFFVSLLLLYVVSIFITPGLGFIDEKVKGIIQAMPAIFFALLVKRSLVIQEKNIVERLFGVLLTVLVLGAILELFGILKPISDAFREFFFTGHGLYSGDQRDIALTGHVRPKLFSSEPSHVTKLFLVLVNSWFLINRSNRKLVIFIILHLFFGWLMSSPTVLLSVAIGLSTYITFSLKQLIVYLIMMTFVILLLIGIWPYISQFSFFTGLESRFNRVLSGTEGSFMDRIITPIVGSIFVLQNSPLFGVGISGKEIVISYYPIKIDLNTVEVDKFVGNNIIGQIVMYFGIIGSAFFFTVFYRYIKPNLGEKAINFLIVILIFGISMGGLETPRFWIFLFTILSAFIISNRQESETEKS